MYFDFECEKLVYRVNQEDIFLLFQICIFRSINFFYFYFLLLVTLYKNWCQNVVLRGNGFVSLGILSTVVTKIYCALKIEEIINVTIFVVFSFFFNYVILGRRILNISKTIFLKQIFHLQLSYQLTNVLLQEFYIHSTYVITYCI